MRGSQRRQRPAAGTLWFRHYSLPAQASLSAVLPVDPPRCGTYVLRFHDGDRYVGQARDVLEG